MSGFRLNPRGYHCFRQGEHLVFYMIAADGIDIIGVPHQAMDVAAHSDSRA